MPAVTTYVHTPEAIVAATVARLEATEALPATLAAPGWAVETFSATSYKDMFARFPGLPLPAVLVCLEGADIRIAGTSGRPQRIYYNLTVLVLAGNADLGAGAVSARDLVFAALALLDDYQSGNATWQATGFDAVDLSAADCAPGVACYAVQFEVGDH
jgi:hypothetical protein